MPYDWTSVLQPQYVFFKAGRFAEPQNRHHKSPIVHSRNVVLMALLHQVSQFRSLLRKIALPFLKGFFVYHLASEWTGSVSPTAGPSMLPTLTVSGDIIYTSKRYARGNGIEFGDLIEFRHPMEPGVGVVKRVMGLPGDFVREDGGVGSGDRMIQVVSTRCFAQAWHKLTRITGAGGALLATW